MTTVFALRALGLGDALTGIPALRGLRRAWPGAELVLATTAGIGQWLVELGVVDRVVPANGLGALPWAGEPPDVAVNLHGCGPQSHATLRALQPGALVAFACPAAGHLAGPAWDPAEHEVDRWVRLVRWAGGSCGPEDLRLPSAARRGAHVVLHPGASAASRRWPAERWAEVAARLAARGHPVVVTGVADESDLCTTVVTHAGAAGVENRCGSDDLAGLDALVATAALVLCGDTGVAHLATAHATPSVVLFGPVSPASWGPRIDPVLHRVLWHPRPNDPPGDPHGLSLDPRLARVGVAEVVAAAMALLSVSARS